MSLKRLIPICLIVIILTGLIYLRQPQTDGQVSRTALIMGTVVDVRAYGEDNAQLEQAVTEAFDEMLRVEQLFSSHIAESEISQLSAVTESLSLNPEVIRLLQIGQQLGADTSGAFNMSLGALKELWQIESENPHIPSEQELSAVLEKTGSGALTIVGARVIKSKPDLRVDLGGIAKGYAVDRAIRVLRKAGIKSATVNAGGDIGLLGDKQGKPWRIGIQHPRQTNDLLVTLQLKDQAVVTSGDYERYFERDGLRYHHIFDPASGKPARQCQSVTVVANDVASADALATAAFVLGPDAGLKLLESLPDVEGLLVSADGQLMKTSGLPE
jgi:FAD:protein FMN transferase